MDIKKEQLEAALDENSFITRFEIISNNNRSVNVCHTEIESHPTENSVIRTVLWIPDNWNGIFIGVGNGGVAGSLDPSFWNYTSYGYAAAQTDMGTSLVVKGIRKTADAELWKDYTWRSTHIMTVLSKKLIECCCGRKPDYSYFIGASAGGLQAFSEAQRFPEDYDGIIAGVPSNNALNLIIYFLWLHVKLHNRDGKGLISKDDAQIISLHAADFFQLRGDGEVGDDFITYPYTDENTVKDFLDFLKSKMPQLSSEQLIALEAIYNGPKNPKTGEQIFCGMPIGAERNSGYFGDKSNGKFGYPWLRLFFGEEYDEFNFDFSDDYEIIKNSIGKDFTAIDTDIGKMIKNGTKLLVYSGAADPAGPWPDAVKYYNKVCERFGGYDKVSEYFRLFILPGKAHGNEGLGANTCWGNESRLSLLDTMRLWREKGIAPAKLTAAHKDIVNDRESLKFIRNINPYRADKLETKEYPTASSDRIFGIKN